MNTEKLLKYAIKTIAKATDLDYDELKDISKKSLKMAKKYDSELLGRIEEILELQDITSEEETTEFDVDTLRLFCRIKEIDHSDSEKSVRHQVWKYLEEQLDMDDSDDSDDSLVEESESSDEEERDVKHHIKTLESTPEGHHGRSPSPSEEVVIKKSKKKVIE